MKLHSTIALTSFVALTNASNLRTRENSLMEQFADHLQNICPYQHVKLASCYDDTAKLESCFSCAFEKMGGRHAVEHTASLDCFDLIELTTTDYNTCIEENHCHEKCDNQMALLSDCALTPFCDGAEELKTH